MNSDERNGANSHEGYGVVISMVRCLLLQGVIGEHRGHGHT